MYRAAPASPRERFLDQFEWGGGDWLYRYKETGAAYRVTDAEKDAFVAAFDRWQRWSFWVGLPFFLAIVFGLIWATSDPAPGSLLDRIKPFLWASGWLLGLALRFPIDHFTFRAPLRTLVRRTPVAPAWSKAARRQRALDRIPSEPLFGGAAICVILLAIFLVEGGLTSGTGQIVIVGLCAYLLWAAVIGFRKWQLARADEPLTSPAL